MSLTRFSVRNYRCFPHEQEIELSKLTVVLGRNNSGKSALVRAPLVMSTGVRRMLDPSAPPALPLALERLGEDAPSFRDLVHGQRSHQRVRFGMDLTDRDGNPGTVEVSIQDVDEWQAQIVDELIMRVEGEEVVFRWSPEPDPVWGESQFYEIHWNGATVRERVRFSGLSPDRLPLGDGSWPKREAFKRLMSGFDQIRYLGPFRTRSGRVRRLPSSAPRSVGATGEDALDILANDVVRGRGRILDALNQLLAENIPGWEVGITDHGIGMYSVHLTSTHDSSIRVSLGDAGTGVVQMLPVLVQRAIDTLPSTGGPPVLEIVEEPELHLHPSAHADLADLFISATLDTRVRFLIETHSETFLLRIRRRIAEGRMAPEDLSLYFVEHAHGTAEARRIGVDRMGNLDYWPSGVFTEDFEETRALAQAQAQAGRLGSDAR
jgi:hypothetical protein